MSERGFLMTPGPTELTTRVLRAQLMPAIEPGDPAFIRVMDETAELLQKVFKTKKEIAFFPGSGRVTIESALASVIEPGDRILAIVNGVFGKWLKETAQRLGADVVELASDWRVAIDPSEVAQKLDSEKDIKLVGVVHNETSTGLRNPVAEIGKIVSEHGALYLVDSVSSLGGDDVRTDDWLIDLNCTGCYKCLNAPPGLSIVSISDKAWEVMERRKRVASTFSFDLYRWRQQWIPKERGGELIWDFRRHPIEPVPHLTYALNEAVKQILEEGLQERFKKNAIAGQAIRLGVRALGLELFPREEKYASNTLTGIKNPEHVSNSELLGTMRSKYGVIPGGGLEEIYGQVIRLAHMSETSKQIYVLYAIWALGSTLQDLGLHVNIDEAVASAREAFHT
ncbi:MAG: alanine--glyoxylate aminotransferase family protein [Candidatus Bathyarchaeia archaeon]|jgi:aspartate aminotransferase-like enzyme